MHVWSFVKNKAHQIRAMLIQNSVITRLYLCYKANLQLKWKLFSRPFIRALDRLFTINLLFIIRYLQNVITRALFVQFFLHLIFFQERIIVWEEDFFECIGSIFNMTKEMFINKTPDATWWRKSFQKYLDHFFFSPTSDL